MQAGFCLSHGVDVLARLVAGSTAVFSSSPPSHRSFLEANDLTRFPLRIDLTSAGSWLPVGAFFVILAVAFCLILWLDGKRHTYKAALVATAPWFPLALSVSTLFAYFTLSPAGLQGDPGPIFVGGSVAMIAWLFAALIFRPFTFARRANSGAYEELHHRLENARDRLSLWLPEEQVRPEKAQPATADSAPLAARSGLSYPCQTCLIGGPLAGQHCAARRKSIAIEEARMLKKSVCETLERIDDDKNKNEPPGLTWVLGTGYVNLWKLTHAAEEALIDLETLDVVIRVALHDEARLRGDAMENGGQLRMQLQRALSDLTPLGAGYLTDLPITSPAVDGTARLPDSGKPNVGNGLATTGLVHATYTREVVSRGILRQVLHTLSGSWDMGRAGLTRERTDPVCAAYTREVVSRSVLREVHHSINDYRDRRRGGLVRARNGLMKTIIFTGVATYALLGIAIMQGPVSDFQPSILAGVAFYLVGALIGLFNRLYQETQSDLAIDDFGLSIARLVQAPMLSGLAGLIGVVVTALLAAVLNGTAGGVGSTTVEVPKLGDIFNLQTNQAGIVVAAIFGLTPGLLIQRLTSTADQYKTQLKNTQAVETPSPIRK